MPAVVDISITNGKATPTTDVYSLSEGDANGGVKMIARAVDPNPELCPRLEFSRSVKLKEKLQTATHVISVPYTETIGSVTTVKFASCRIILVAPTSCPSAVRKDLRTRIRNSLADAQLAITSFLDDFSGFV